MNTQKAKDIAAIVNGARALEAEIENMESALFSKKAMLRFYQETVLPDLFEESGITKLTLEEGIDLRLGKTYFVAFEDQEKAMEWFKTQGLESIFKRDVVVHCPTEEYKNLLTDQLGLTQYDYKVGHHWKTMSAQVAELVEKGVTIPDYIQVTEVSKVHINNGKK